MILICIVIKKLTINQRIEILQNWRILTTIVASWPANIKNMVPTIFSQHICDITVRDLLQVFKILFIVDSLTSNSSAAPLSTANWQVPKTKLAIKINCIFFMCSPYLFTV